ncbi:hypothetical protein [Pengzhenrongella frigida]|uniref:Uncharacterized protein n=1 Tax=Pengzhenrongella frigida TaxID=1259133 RepID=A0A4V1ZHN2_9MICO|nr:hypothetical protein [Cellulomonas sp. HLT2-17]RYV52634.1 hypothetical protein EUA98_02770 [Cellulomonas sp. HLT2-17]
MRNDDVLAQLGAVNPVSEADLSPVDAGALVALREGITMTGRQLPLAHSSRRRIGRRGVTGAIVTVALLGGGAAFAAHQLGYVGGGGAADGITCLTHWVGNNDGFADSTGGPPLTADPVADCQQYQALSGRPPIDDPVAFRAGNPMVFVAPRDQVPADATLFPAVTPRDEVLFELDASTVDMVDGLGSSCLAADDANVFAQAELDRLGLTDWSVTNKAPGTRPPPPVNGEPEGPWICATAFVDPDQLALVVTPNNRDDIETHNGHGTDPFVFELRDSLRIGIADKCVNLGEAKAVATSALGDAHHWPLTAIEDPAASCTRVDMAVGGSIEITLRGPSTTTP